jgi:hypothetical protein
MRFHRTVEAGNDVATDVLEFLDQEADRLGVSFYVDNQEDKARKPLNFAHGAPTLASATLDRLRAFAEKRGVTIYVHPRNVTNEHSERAIITGPSSKD